jgi:hypothetical protein
MIDLWLASSQVSLKMKGKKKRRTATTLNSNRIGQKEFFVFTQGSEVCF